MSDFGRELARLMEERGTGVRALARAVPCNPGHVSNLRSGRNDPSASMAARLDAVLGAGGSLREAARQVPLKPRTGRQAWKPSKAIEAIEALAAGDPDGETEVASDHLADLVGHYARVVATAPTPVVYDELFAIRSYAGTLLSRGRPVDRADLTVTAGWFSGLLAAAATDLGEHAAAVVWCRDTERRAAEAGYPELLGWAALTRAVIAWYQGNAPLSAGLAAQGYSVAPEGTAARVRLASQEMRSHARVGDIPAAKKARLRAIAAMEQLAPGTPASGVFGIPPDTDPPYTATSLLAEGRHADAAGITRRIIGTAYKPLPPGEQPTRYARTLLILALAAAGMGDADEAAAAGTAALESGRLVWPTMVLAGQLDASLAQGSPDTAHTADFHARYIDAAGQLALPAAEGDTG
jgi:transcriptional regulator with XRE-family HTH domain